jgi:NADH-ubiquinone oxidoreductase chain 1
MKRKFMFITSINLKTVFYFNVMDNIFYSLFLILPLIICIAFFTLAERKGMASIQRRIGPNVVGF